MTFANMLSTESVVVKKPNVINSYQDFLNWKLRPPEPYISPILSDYTAFTNGKKGTLTRRIFDLLSDEKKNIHNIPPLHALMGKGFAVN
jgi:hypothetical protein